MKLRKKEEMEKKKELTLDMLQPSRYKPNDLEQMAEETKFSKSKYTDFLDKKWLLAKCDKQ